MLYNFTVTFLYPGEIALQTNTTEPFICDTHAHEVANMVVYVWTKWNEFTVSAQGKLVCKTGASCFAYIGIIPSLDWED